jgi:hypothetical protein
VVWVKLVVLLGRMIPAIPCNQLHTVVSNATDNHWLKLAVFLERPCQGSDFGVVMCQPASILSDHDLGGVNQEHVLSHNVASLDLHGHLVFPVES